MAPKPKLTPEVAARIRALKADDPTLSQRKIAEAVGLDQALVSRVLSGKAQYGDPADAEPAAAVFLPFSRLAPPAANPRTVFDEAALADLARSILDRGLLQPLTVGPAGADGRHPVRLGERRFRALGLLVERGEMADSAPVPCVVSTNPLEGADLLLDQLAENTGREDMTPLDEAAAYAALFFEHNRTTDDIARAVGRTRRHVQSRLALRRDLTPDVREALAAGTITLAQAEALTKADKAEQNAILPRLAAGELATEAAVKQALAGLRAPTMNDTYDDAEDPLFSASPPGEARGGQPTPTDARPDHFLGADPAPVAPPDGERRSPLDDLGDALAAAGPEGLVAALVPPRAREADPDPAEAAEPDPFGLTPIASPPSSPPGEARGVQAPQPESTENEAAAEDPPTAAPPPACDTARRDFGPFRHFRVVEAAPDADNLPRTLTLEDIISGRRARYAREKDDLLDIPAFLRRTDTSPPSITDDVDPGDDA